MTNLIIHIGPGKCGSSSIQHFFATEEKPCIQNTHYKLLDPSDISKLNREEPGPFILTSFGELLLSELKGCNALILSHEYLFQCPYAIKNICVLAESLVTNIFIIGYSRKQSGFLISAYSQWLFRAPARIKEVTAVLDDLKLDSILFSGLERQLIASIANDLYSARQLSDYSILDWYNSYQKIAQLAHEHGAVVKCGVLPAKGSDVPLIHDFCKKSGLILHDKLKAVPSQAKNTSFNKDIVEAINNAVNLGLEGIPGPHESNQILNLFSHNMIQPVSCSVDFLENLKSYIDTYYISSNDKLCREYGLCEDYFAPSVRFSKAEILAIIMHEGEQRALNCSDVISNYRMLSARMLELCLKLTQDC